MSKIQLIEIKSPRPLSFSLSFQAAINKDMSPENSWPAASGADKHAPFKKRLKVIKFQLMPIQPLL